MELMTERLILREYTMEDNYNLYELFSKEYVIQYAPYLHKKSISDVNEYIKFYIDNAKSSNRTHYYFIIELQSTHEFAGIIGYAFVGEEVSIRGITGALVEIEYYLLEKYWHKGYMSEALKKLLKFAFEENGVQKAFAICQTENVKSEKVMVKCGMYKSAEQPEAKVYNGEPKERLKYELTSDNYFRV